MYALFFIWFVASCVILWIAVKDCYQFLLEFKSMNTNEDFIGKASYCVLVVGAVLALIVLGFVGVRYAVG